MTMVDEEQNSRIDAAAAPVNGQPPQSPEPGAAEAPGSYPPAAQPPAGQPPAAGVQTAGAQPERVDVVGIRFRDAGKIYYFKPGELELKPGERVIVETSRGIEFGTVVVGQRKISPEESVAPLREVIRKAAAEDCAKMEDNKRRAQEAFKICEQKIAEHALPMKLIDVEFTFDAGKVLFYFTAEGRVDFRDLVKDLAAVFRTRIELRQIGVRDEAKMLGGLGPCGRELCCSTWLGDFVPVSIRMAKGQNLSLNPTKISGICGRLMCCLKYEDASYKGCPKAAAAPAGHPPQRVGHPEGGHPPGECNCPHAPAAAKKPAPDIQKVVFDEESPSEEGF